MTTPKLTEYCVQYKLTMRNGKKSVCFSDTFYMLGEAESATYQLIEDGHQIMGIWAVDFFTGDMTRIENGERLHREYEGNKESENFFADATEQDMDHYHMTGSMSLRG